MMSNGAGKGDKPRNNSTKEWFNNFDLINWQNKKYAKNKRRNKKNDR